MSKKATTNPVFDLIRREIRKGSNLTFGFGRPYAPGAFVAEAYHSSSPYPLCQIWFGWCENNSTINIYNIQTDDWYRRCGLARALLFYVLNSYPNVVRVISDVGTDTGRPFMKSRGFKPRGDYWELIRKNFKA